MTRIVKKIIFVEEFAFQKNLFTCAAQNKAPPNLLSMLTASGWGGGAMICFSLGHMFCIVVNTVFVCDLYWVCELYFQVGVVSPGEHNGIHKVELLHVLLESFFLVGIGMCQ